MNTNEEVVKKEPHGLYGPWGLSTSVVRLRTVHMALFEEDHAIANLT